MMYIESKDYPINVHNQSTEVPGSGGARQSKLTPIGVTLDYLYSDAKTVAETLHRGLRMSGDGPCLGWRESTSDYKWLSYAEVIQRSKNISFGLLKCGMERGQDTFLGIYAQNCVEWVLVEHACFCQSVVTVPLYDTLGPESFNFILNLVEASIVVCDTETKVRCLLDNAKELPKLKQIVAINNVGDEVQRMAEEKNVTLRQLQDVEEMGERKAESLLLPSPSDLATICFTSGTTGNPKGVTLTHGNMVADASAFIKHLGTHFFSARDRYMSYLPLAHMLERIGQIITFTVGGRVGFFRGDVTTLIDDILALKPTLLPAVPRVLNKIYDKVQNEVNASKMKKFLLNVALKAKQADLKRGVLRNTSVWDRLVLKNIRDALGGEVRLLLTGGAPIGDEILNFFRCGVGCVVVNAFGQTEASSAVTVSVMGEFSGSNIGPPVPCCFVKLIDVPEMNYFARNSEGEILVKGSNVTQGYFKDPARTAEAIDENGWLYTGDIGRWEENGSLSIIDRKKNILKLSQGEFVCPERIETVYATCPYVEQIYVHGDSLKSCLVAIVVPSQAALLSWCSDNCIKGEWTEICRNNVIKKHVLNQLNVTGKAAGLKGFELVKAIHLNPGPFTQQNGILTATMKVKRQECRKQFHKILEGLYVGLK